VSDAQLANLAGILQGLEKLDLGVTQVSDLGLVVGGAPDRPEGAESQQYDCLRRGSGETCRFETASQTLRLAGTFVQGRGLSESEKDWRICANWILPDRTSMTADWRK
jgi:hypothetical protein